MARSAAGKSLSLLMAAVVLSAATAPPAVRHSHEGGDVPHTHRADALAQRHEHPHDHPHIQHAAHPQTAHLHAADAHAAHPHGSPQAEAPAAYGSSGIGPTVHYHVWWLGMEWHLPALPHDESSDRDVPLLDTCLVQLSGECVVGPPHETAGRAAGDVDRHVATRVDVDDARWFFSGLPPLLLPPPLCDVARHERSGVQLA